MSAPPPFTHCSVCGRRLRPHRSTLGIVYWVNHIEGCVRRGDSPDSGPKTTEAQR